MALDYGDFKAEIITVDSQDSLSGGVLVMVTGSLFKKLTGRRNFVQSFFLAPQEKGYFVLNDIFRYLDEDESQTSRVAPVVANGLPVPSHVHALPEPGTCILCFFSFFLLKLMPFPRAMNADFVRVQLPGVATDLTMVLVVLQSHRCLQRTTHENCR